MDNNICEKCACESVCKYKHIFNKAIEQIMNNFIGENNQSYRVKDYPHIVVKFECPHFVSVRNQSVEPQYMGLEVCD